MNTEKISFKNKSGNDLSARLELPTDQAPHNYVLFAHCFTCTKDLLAVRNISRSFTQNGFGVFRFDFTGLGQSKGDFEDSTFSNNVEDLIAAADFLENNYQSPTVMVGHSLGGAAVLFASRLLESIKAVATIGAPSYPGHVSHLFEDYIEEIEKSDSASVSIGGRPFTITKEFLDDLMSQDSHNTIKNLSKALLVMHSPQDEVVDISNAKAIYESAMHPKSFISLDGADHLLTNNKDAIYTGDVIANWAERYLVIEEKEKIISEHQVVAKLDAVDSYTTDIRSNKHTWLADEPTSIGGNDFGPTPYELVASGLAACTAITLKMYCERKKWEIDDVKVHVDYLKAYPKSADQSEKGAEKMDRFNRVIEINGKLDDSKKARLLEIADKCPVHKTLEKEIDIHTQLKDE